MAALPGSGHEPARPVRSGEAPQPRNPINPAILSHRIAGVGSTAVTTPACAALPQDLRRAHSAPLYSLHHCYSVSTDSSAPMSISN
jgi:hypothetical protein